MQKIDLRRTNHNGYNLDCHVFSLPGAPAGVMTCTLAPGERSEAHNHLEREIFLFTSGSAQVVTPSGETSVEAGDAVLFERFESHVVENESGSQPVTFYAIYWQDQEADSTIDGDAALVPLLVFSTPPTPNGDLHCGHLSGPYIAGDVLARAQRLMGGTAWHVTGRDDHQTYVDKKARQEGLSAQAVADNYALALQDTWKAYAVNFDGFITPDRNGAYAAFVREGVRRLVAEGFVDAETWPAAFSTEGDYLHEAFISGGCPHCGELSDGNACEACGRPNVCTDLVRPKAFESGLPPVTKQSTRLVFRLSKLQKRLEEYIKSSEMSARTMAMSLALLEDGLPDISVSHPTSWGLPVAACGVEDHILYVWFEMAFGYLWGASHLSCAYGEDAWARAASVYEGRLRIAHCYGFDNSWYHTVLFPAVYLALGLTPPRVHVVNELLDLDGAKFSTSRGHLIWGRTLRCVLPPDLARYALLRNRPEGVRSNFTLSSVEDQLQHLFNDTLPGWLEAFSKQVATFEYRMPEPGSWIGEHQRYHARLQMQATQLSQAMQPESASPRHIAQLFEEIALDGERFQRAQSYFFDGRVDGENYRRSAVALGAVGLRLLTVAALVVTPELGKYLTKWLDLETTFPQPMNAEFLAGGHTIAVGSCPLPSLCPDSLAERIDSMATSLQDQEELCQ